MYKDLKKKYLEQKKVNKNLTDTQKEETKNMEIIQQKYNELVKAQMQAKEELRQKEEKEKYDEEVINEFEKKMKMKQMKIYYKN